VKRQVYANKGLAQNVPPHVVSHNQSAFIPKRPISNNILEAYETLHFMQTRMWGKTCFMVLKLDMNKAYDKVE
jgi:hypothetical protein